MSRTGLILILTPLVILVGSMAYEGYHGYRLISFTAQLSDKIQTDLRKGSTMTDVMTFMDEQGLTERGTSSYLNYDGIPPEVTSDDIPQSEQARVEYTAGAIKRNYYNVFLLKMSVSIDFYFDKDQRLLWSQIDQSGTGIPPFWWPFWQLFTSGCPASAVCEGVIPLADS